ncbi:hypothetical protein JL49_23940 [Pseudoalteromonas luteoviolacea]|nr:hypothetical protein JL49_23940 [Pseudoalteromonas luteoviolacea]
MKLTYSISADGQDITNKIADRLLSLTIIDERGLDSDTLTIKLDDRDNQIALPKQGAELNVILGVDKQSSDKGIYIVDEVIITGTPDTLEIRCKAADMRTSLKERKTKSWDKETLGAILEAVASNHGLTPSIAPEFSSIAIEHIDQTNESDLHLITRLAKEYDAVGKVAASHLLFTTKGASKSASGKQLPRTVVKKTQVSDFQVVIADRGKYQSAQAYWHELTTGERISVTVGAEPPLLSIKHTYNKEADAKRAAQAKLDALRRGTSSGSITMPCTDKVLAIMAEGTLVLEGFREGVAGEWVVTRSQYDLSSSGLIVSVDFETPK